MNPKSNADRMISKFWVMKKPETTRGLITPVSAAKNTIEEEEQPFRGELLLGGRDKIFYKNVENCVGLKVPGDAFPSARMKSSNIGWLLLFIVQTIRSLRIK
jgi:hypothetical protein